jgi:hypothetical protein
MNRQNEIQNHSAPFTGHSAAGKNETHNRKQNKMSEDTENNQAAPTPVPATPSQEAPTEAAPAPAAPAEAKTEKA